MCLQKFNEFGKVWLICKTIQAYMKPCTQVFFHKNLSSFIKADVCLISRNHFCADSGKCV